MSLVLDTGTMKYRENPNQPWRPLVIKAGMNWESMADTYDPDNGTYEIGQYVLENGVMYRCIYAIDTPETWTPVHWTEINIGDELFSLQDSIASEATTRASEDTLIRNTLNHLEDGLAIIVDSDTCLTSIPVGGYAYIKNNTHGLAEGLYTNTSASAFPTSGGTANSSVFTSVSGGGLNSLKDSLSQVGDQVQLLVITDTDTTTVRNLAKSVDDFKLITIEFLNSGGALFASNVIPTAVFKTHNGGYNPIVLYVYDGSGFHTAYVQYISSTTVYAAVGTSGYVLTIRGIK